MATPLQVGDRVRLTCKYRGPRFRPGDMGTIAALMSGFPQGMRVYQVRLEDHAATLYSAFYEEELERA